MTRPTSRRHFLQRAAATAGALTLAGACDADTGAASSDATAADTGAGDVFAADVVDDVGGHDGAEVTLDVPAPPLCADPFEGGALLATLPFVGEGTAPRDTPIGAGLDGRLYTNLETLTAETLLTPIERFYIRTRVPDRLDLSTPWEIRVHGLVDAPLTLAMADLEPMIRDQGTHVLECSGNGRFAHFGLLSATTWRGVAIQDVLALVSPSPEATRVLISGFDDHSQPSANSNAGASWVFSFEDLGAWGGFLATHMGGAPLTPDHGFPVRFLMPRWYGCTCAKWVDEIKLVDDSEPSTTQMREYAFRTHQTGVPQLAKDYIPAAMNQAAMPVRVEQWDVDGEVLYKIVGVLWGGWQVIDGLEIQLGSEPWVPVDVCPAMQQNATWTLWSHAWRPVTSGRQRMRLRVSDPAVPTLRLDAGFYDRSVDLP